MPQAARSALSRAGGPAALAVAHWPAGGPGGAWRDRAFLLETCLRQVVATTDAAVAAELRSRNPAEWFTGGAAYRFLLEVAAGLRSAVPGETNVFGQFRRAWEACRGSVAAQPALAGVIAAVISDTRAIRNAHLQGIGGASYGSLVRQLLSPEPGERVLFVGAGELARSMLPFFRAFPIGVWNRREPGPAFAAAARLFAPADGADAAAWAHHVVLTTPADAGNDARWLGWLQGSPARTVVHLGRRRHEGGTAWSARAAAYDLDDLFELRRSRDNIRSLQLQRARLACGEHALAFAARHAPAGRLASA